MDPKLYRTIMCLSAKQDFSGFAKRVCKIRNILQNPQSAGGASSPRPNGPDTHASHKQRGSAESSMEPRTPLGNISNAPAVIDSALFDDCGERELFAFGGAADEALERSGDESFAQPPLVGGSAAPAGRLDSVAWTPQTPAERREADRLLKERRRDDSARRDAEREADRLARAAKRDDAEYCMREKEARAAARARQAARRARQPDERLRSQLARPHGIGDGIGVSGVVTRVCVRRARRGPVSCVGRV